MKKIFLQFLLVVGMVGMTHAQTQKGSWMLDGEVGTVLSNTKSLSEDHLYEQKDHHYNIYLRPSVGYFIKDNWAIGLASGFQFVGLRSRLETSYEPIAKGEYNVYSFQVFTRKYFPIDEKISLFGDLRLGYNFHITKVMDEDDIERIGIINSVEGSTNIGIQYMVTDFLGIHLQSTFLHFRQSISNKDNFFQTSNETEFQGGLFTNFGIGSTFFF